MSGSPGAFRPAEVLPGANVDKSQYGLWLRAQLRGDAVARALIYLVRGSADGTARVRTD